MKRAFDLAVSLALLTVLFPVIAAAAIGIRLSSPGPVFYRAVRVGKDGRPFEMMKLRTMHQAGGGSVITSKADPRVFRLGAVLRRLKIDEFPQFWNVVTGDMSIVGPRPEDPKIVQNYYSDWMLETLGVRPGITSMGSIYYYSQGEQLIDDDDPEGSYVERALPAKLAVERAYMERATPLSDIWCVILTAASVVAAATGRPLRASERDLKGAEKWAPASEFAAPSGRAP